MDPLQWMGAVRMRAQTADKNTIIHKKFTPLLILTSPIHCRGFIGKQVMQWLNFSKKQTHLHNFEQIFFFGGWTIPLICYKTKVLHYFNQATVWNEYRPIYNSNRSILISHGWKEKVAVTFQNVVSIQVMIMIQNMKANSQRTQRRNLPSQSPDLHPSESNQNTNENKAVRIA